MITSTWLPLQKITALVCAVTSVVVDRATLLSGLDPRFVGSLPLTTSLGGQILMDLHSLNRTRKLADGVLPLLVWLHNADALLVLRRERRVVRAALVEVNRRLDEHASRRVRPDDERRSTITRYLTPHVCVEADALRVTKNA